MWHNNSLIKLLALLLFSCLFGGIDSIPIMVKDSLWMDDQSPMDISALRNSMHLKQLLGKIQLIGLQNHGHLTAEDKEDPTKLLLKGQAMLRKVEGNDGTELSVNREISHELFEGDILLSRAQALQILGEVEADNKPPVRRIHPRQLNPDPNTFWKDVTIAFTVPNDAALLQSVQAAHRHISSQTCIRFAYYSDSSWLVGKRDYIEYYRQSGCWSMVGRQGGSQIISIGYGCETLGIVTHETMHALGFWHEQSRTDQEYHVSINFNNVVQGTESNFYKRSPDTSDNLGQPYDLGSVMHYSDKSFARDYNQYTIRALDPSYQQTMGFRGGLSFKDAKMINLQYCSKICAYELACRSGGYTDPNNCNRCLCPVGYTGVFCDEIPTPDGTKCSNPGALMAGEFAGNIATFSTLTPNTNCYWKILPETAEKRVMLTIRKLSFPCKDTCESYVEVKAKQDKTATGARICCAIPATIYADIGTEVLIILNAAADVTEGNYTGFQIDYTSIWGSAQFEVPPIINNSVNSIHPNATVQHQIVNHNAKTISNGTIWQKIEHDSTNSNGTIRQITDHNSADSNGTIQLKHNKNTIEPKGRIRQLLAISIDANSQI